MQLTLCPYPVPRAFARAAVAAAVAAAAAAAEDADDAERPPLMLPPMPTGIDADAETPMLGRALAVSREAREVEAKGGGSCPGPKLRVTPLLG